MNKVCSKCQLSQPLENFHLKSGGQLGRREQCKNCRSQKKPKEWEGGFRTCKSCDETKENKEFPLSQHGSPRSVCKSCKGRYENYGMSKQQVTELLESQNHVCKICKKYIADKRFSVDHDHTCCPGVKTCGSCVRAALCITCNSQLGWFEKHHDSIIKYLQKGD